MLTVEIDRIVPSDSEIRFGCVVRYGQDGPVRFVQVRLGDEHLDWKTTAALMEYLTARVNRHLDQERDIADEPTLFEA